MALSRSVREAINAEMNRQGISKRALARRVGMSQQYFWRRCSTAERANLEFTPSELEAIATELRVPVSRLLRVPARVA